MSVLDRIHRTPTGTTGNVPTSSAKSGTQTSASTDPPVVRRLRIVIKQLSDFAASSGGESRFAKYSWLLNSMMDEVLDELADSPSMDADKMGKWFEEFGKVIQWTGSGDETILPDVVKTFLITEHPEEIRLAIEP